MAKELKLNIGCGSDLKVGWINLDIDERVRPDLVHDLNNPLPFKSETVSEINAQDILEHFTSEDVEKVISEISRVLIVGGQLRVRVPNVDDIFERFSNSPETRNIFLYGDTSVTGVWGAHKVGFTPKVLLAKMKKFGLRMSSFKKVDTNFEGIFIKESPRNALKKITFINQTLDMGGAEIFNAELLNAFQQDGVEIVAYTTEPRFVKLLIEKKIKAEKIPVIMDVVGNWKGLIKAVFYFPKGVSYYWQVVKQNRDADIFLLSGFTEKFLVSPIAYLYHVPVVWIEFGPISPLLKKFFSLPKLWYRLVKNIPLQVIVPSVYTKTDVLTSGRIALDRISVIPCGRDISLKVLSELKKNKVQEQTVVCVSRLEPGKGQDLLIEAFALVIKKFPKARLLITGESHWKKDLEKLIQKFHLEKSVTLLGRVPDSLKVMSEAEICVFPSVWDLEGFGLVTIEAMALGKPIIAFKHGPTSEILFDNWNGFLVEKGNVAELAEKIMLVMNQPQNLSQITAQAQQDFQKRFQIKEIKRLYLNAFLTVIATNNIKKTVQKIADQN